MSLQLGVRFLHLGAAITWIGGMLFIALVLVPVTRGLDDVALRRRLVQATGRRFRVVGWIALAVLVLTGLVNVAQRPELLGVTRFWVKAGLVVLALALSAVHDFVLGPRAGRPDLHPRARTQASWLARVEIVVVLVIVALGLALRG
jgi:putative copper export protein